MTLVSFILSDDKTNDGYDVRIFTPDQEVPFAGHPTLGTAYIIKNEIAMSASKIINLNLGVGQIPVTFEDNTYIWMKQKPPQFGRLVDAKTAAEILSIPEDNLIFLK